MLQILGGAHLPRKTKDNGKFCGDMVDVFVKVSLFDKIGKAKCQSFKTQIIKDNGILTLIHLSLPPDTGSRINISLKQHFWCSL